METLQIIQIKQIIKIFLASSKELSNDRYAFGNFVRRLNKTYEKRGIRLDLFEWEDYDAAYNNRRKQDEYDDQIRDSDMFLALFRTWAGKFTIEEFDVAVEEFRRTGKKPKNYVYIRDLFEGETETDELIAFKRRLSDEMGYFWIRYNNNDSLQLHFVMQLQLVESNRFDSLKVENGEVKFGDMTIAQMDNLRFAAGNEEYKRMSQRLAELPGLIEKARLHVENYPNEKDFKNELQELLNERNKLQDDLDQQQQFLLDTAMRITRLLGERITDRMRRAMEAFEEGNVHEANIILDEAEHDADRNLTDFRQSKELTEQKRQNVIYSIDELLFKTSTLMADASIPIDKRINQVKVLYSKADRLAAEVNYDKEKYFCLLSDYVKFLSDYGLYKEAEVAGLLQISIAEALYGIEHPNTAASYKEIGSVYWKHGDYEKAFEYDFKALTIQKQTLGMEHLDTARSYNDIGTVYDNQGNYGKSLEYLLTAASIKEKILGKEHHNTAVTYNNLGLVYWNQGDYDKALEFHKRALEIRKKVLGMEHPLTAQSYNNTGMVYYIQGNYDKALLLYLKALEIWEKTLGMEHPDTAASYNNIGMVYKSQSNYNNALEYCFKALEIWKEVLNIEHPNIATSYYNIGLIYEEQGNYKTALDYYSKSYQIRKKKLGEDHPKTKVVLTSINDAKEAMNSSKNK